MRLKNIPAAAEAIEKSEWCIKNAAEHKGQWNKVFSNNNPIDIEIGMGKGQFIIEMAKRNPGKNFIGMEKYSSVIYRGVQKLDAMKEENEDPKNLFLLCEDAADLRDYFAEGELSGIYLNFSDPWPKDRHAKRRLTHRRFLELYHGLLEEGGKIQLKTDNVSLFDFSIDEIEDTEFFDLKEVDRDIYKDGPPEGNIATEYEDKFSAAGNAIARFVAQKV